MPWRGHVEFPQTYVFSHIMITLGGEGLVLSWKKNVLRKTCACIASRQYKQVVASVMTGVESDGHISVC